LVACLLAGNEITEVSISNIMTFQSLSVTSLPTFLFITTVGCVWKKIVSLSVCYDSLPNLTHQYAYINLSLILWANSLILGTRSGVLHLCLDTLRNYASCFLIIAVIIIVSKPFWFYLSI